MCGRETGGSEVAVSSVDIGSLDVSTPDPEDAVEDPVVAARVGTDRDPGVDPAPHAASPGWRQEPRIRTPLAQQLMSANPCRDLCWDRVRQLDP